MPPVVFSAYSISNSLGPMHTENQDTYLTDQDLGLFAVADGVGGYGGAKEASELAIGGLKKRAYMISENESSFQSVLREIHEEIEQRANRLHIENMGTTIAAAKVFPDDSGKGGLIITANVGDSPILFFPNKTDAAERCMKVYIDDSHRDEYPFSMSGIIQYLGLPEWEIDVHTFKFRYATGDIVLICSDGVTDNLVLRNQEGRDPLSKLGSIVRDSRSAQRVAESAIAAGIKPDDMTAILLLL